MKKTRFFYGIHYFLLVFLGWLLLFYKAVEVNQSRIQEKEEKHNLTENVKEESALEEIASEESALEESIPEKNNPDEGFSESKTQQEPSDPEIRVLLMDSDYQS